MELNILYSSDHKYVNIMATSLLSLILNNANASIHFHIITSGFKETDYILINNIINGAKNCRVSYYDLDNFDISKYKIPEWRGTQIANSRLFFADIIETSGLDSLLYLDSDTLVVGDLKELMNVNAPISAVLETTLKYRLKELDVNRYFNSGVLLFNVVDWIEKEYQRQIIEFKQSNPNLVLKYPDQDLLNASIGGIINPLPAEYNVYPYALVESNLFKKSFYHDKRKFNPIQDIDSVVKNAKIYHSAGFASIKPWMENNANPLNKEFEYYMEMLNPDLNKEKLSGLKRILASNKKLCLFIIYLKTCVLPERIVKTAEDYALKRK